MWGRLVDGIKEKIALLKLLQPIAKWRIGILGAYGLVALVITGLLLGCMNITYILLSIAAVIVYIILIVLEILNQ